MKGILILALIFYFLSLLQTSFLVHFKDFGIIPNMILISVLFLNFLETPKKNRGVWGAVFGGFFWDIFSDGFIGFHILILLVLSILIKLILRRYIQFPIRG